MIGRADLERLYADDDFDGVFSWKLFCSHDGTGDRKPTYLGRLSGALMRTSGGHAEWAERAGVPSAAIPVRFVPEHKTKREGSRVPTAWNGKGIDSRGMAELGHTYSNLELPLRCPACHAAMALSYERAAALVAFLFSPADGDGYLYAPNRDTRPGRPVAFPFRAR